jgi:SAM-dependent methyltransferase
MTADAATIRDTVNSRYGAIASAVLDASSGGGCCGAAECGGTGCCGEAGCDTISAGLYDDAELGAVPAKAALASLGCGRPTAVAELAPGEFVLDLGSGGGIDVLLSAARVGPRGFVYGLDVTPQMIDLARANATEAGVSNVEFLLGDMAAVPLPDASVDVILSNCVVNLSPDKDSVFREAFRVLKPGGRVAISDIVIHADLEPGTSHGDQRRLDVSAWAGCVAGALTSREYHDGLAGAGFTDISLEVTRHYAPEDLPTPWPAWVLQLGHAEARALVAAFGATTIRARRPI